MISKRSFAVSCLAVSVCALLSRGPACAAESVDPSENPAAYTHLPIPAGKAARTHLDYDRMLRTYHLRTITGTYEKFGTHDPKWDSLVKTYISEYSWALTDEPGCVTDQQLYKDARAIMELGCNDPMVLLFAGNAYCNLDHMKEGLPLLEKSLDEFENSPYPKAEAMTNARRLILMHDENPGLISDAVREKALRLCIKWIGDSLDDGSFQPGDDRVAIDLCVGGLTNFLGSHWKEVCASIEGKGAAVPYAARTIAGRAYIGAGWDARGSDWAYKVTEEGWKGLKSNLALAKASLTEAWKLNPSYPEAPAAMITVTMGQDSTDQRLLRTWFDRAVAAQMDYEPAYSALRTSLLPRWEGSQEELYKFGVECLNTRRFDTSVPGQFLTALEWAAMDDENPNKWWKRPGAARHLEDMYDGYSAACPANAREQQSNKAAVEWFCGQYAAARHTMKSLGAGLSPEAFKRWYDADMREARSESFALGGSCAQAVAKADALASKRDYAGAIAMYRRLSNSAATESEALPYINHRLAAVMLEKQLAGGKYIALDPQQSLSGWKTIPQNHWNASPDGTVEGRTTWDWLVLQPDCRVGGRWEITGDVEAVSGTGSEPQVGVCWNFVNVGTRGVTGVLIQKAENKVGISSELEKIVKAIDCAPSWFTIHV